MSPSRSANTLLSNWKLKALSSATVWSAMALSTVGASLRPGVRTLVSSAGGLPLGYAAIAASVVAAPSANTSKSPAPTMTFSTWLMLTVRVSVSSSLSASNAPS